MVCKTELTTHVVIQPWLIARLAVKIDTILSVDMDIANATSTSLYHPLDMRKTGAQATTA